jgi:hypothetical protein
MQHPYEKPPMKILSGGMVLASSSMRAKMVFLDSSTSARPTH